MNFWVKRKSWIHGNQKRSTVEKTIQCIMFCVYMKCEFSLGYHDLEEMRRIRGANIDHSILHRWVSRFFSSTIDSTGARIILT